MQADERTSRLKIDLDDFTPPMTRRLNEIYKGLLQDYTELVDSITERFRSDFYWPFTSFVSRNPWLSSSLREIAQVLLCLEMASENGGVTEIRTSSRSIYDTLRIRFRNNTESDKTSVILVKKKGSPLKGSLREKIVQCLSLLLFIKTQLRFRKYIRRYTSKGNDGGNLNGKTVRLVQTDIFSKNLESDSFELRDFKGLSELSDVDFYIFPYLYINTKTKISDFINGLANIKNYKLIFRESYLHLVDYLKLFSFRSWHRRFHVKNILFHGIDVSPIVQADIRSPMDSSNSFYGVLDYLCMKRMSDAGLRIEKVVGWYEGQPSSLGLFYGYRKFFPKGKSLGYVGYPMDETHFHLAPSQLESKLGYVPENIGVISQLSKEFLGQFGPVADIQESPCFRMRNPQGTTSEISPGRKVLLVTLPYLIEECTFILNLLKQCEDAITSEHIKVMFKNHPVHTSFSLTDYAQDSYSFDFSFIEGSFYDFINDFTILLSATSGTVYEAAMYGKRVLIAVFPNNIYQTYLPHSWEGSGYSLIFDVKSLKEALTDSFITHADLDCHSLRLYQPDVDNVHNLLM